MPEMAVNMYDTALRVPFHARPVMVIDESGASRARKKSRPAREERGVIVAQEEDLLCSVKCH